ncbi:(2Fe-2S)-binding protein [Thermobifida halotolerans]|uniref:(2Fe-2S)-binding protein n=1 Tax=Thermobifida halotolerans TaxID=483545 RepID=A0A399FTX1_9ACTN|nr:(2Fe-2S)-binding protein [Thermobifida halotolerans]UOE18017.1 (2Fe-2S)-binding protein [Thermobifida halotolerans]
MTTATEGSSGLPDRRVFDALAGLGGYFELVPLDSAASGGLHSFAELYGTPELLDARIAWVAHRYGPVEPRVSASVAHLGFAARLVSPALAAACAGTVLDVPAASLLWREGSERVTSWLAGPYGAAAVPDGADGAAELLRQSLVERHLRPLGAAVRSRVRVSERLLWGNAAAAVGGAVQMISLKRPEWADRAAAIATALVERAPLAGLGHLVRPDADRPHRFFVRRSCCLYYRAPEGGKCGDCALLDSGTRARRWRSAMADPAV